MERQTETTQNRRQKGINHEKSLPAIHGRMDSQSVPHAQPL